MEFVVARNPDEESSLPFLVKLPLASGEVILKVRDTWPRTAKVYCHPSNDAWPTGGDLDVVETVGVKSCVRRGVAIDLVLDRARENRSQFVFTKARGRDMVFWQSARTRKQARPNVTVPTARAGAGELEIVVDTRERYAWKFSDQQATVTKRALPVGDYAIDHSRDRGADESDGVVLAVAERKSIEDLVSTIVGGKLWMLLAALADVRHSALVVEDRYSALFKLSHVRPVTVTTQLAEATVRYPMVPIVFAETRKLAQEWTYRFFAAAVDHAGNEAAGTSRLLELQPTNSSRATNAGPRPSVVRAWARAAGFPVADRGRIRPDIYAAYQRAHPTT